MSAADLAVSSAFRTIDPNAMSWRGEWGIPGVYQFGNVVTYEGTPYICTNPSGLVAAFPGVNPGWEPLASDSIPENLDVSGNLSVAGSITQGDPALGKTTISVDSIDNPNIEIVAEEGGDGQAYFDLRTNKLSTTQDGQQHLVRSIVGNTGAYTVFHSTDGPGPGVPLQQMQWSSDGTEIRFIVEAGDVYITEQGLRAPSYVTLAGQNGDIAVDAITTIFTISASSLPVGKPAQIPVNLLFFSGDLGQFYFVTLIVNAVHFDNNIYAYAENQAAADTALLQQTGEAWNLLLSGAGTPTLSILIETQALPPPGGSTGWFCNYNATFLGAQ